MAVIHQSDISAWIRCPTAFRYQRQGRPSRQSSALAYGSVMHHALEVFERVRHTDGVDFHEAITAAVSTFEWYWHPANIEAICPKVDLWLPRQGYAELRQRGSQAIRAYAAIIKADDHQLLATEYGFQVPIAGTWDEDSACPHILAGTIDRLAVRHFMGKPYVAVDDYKTGREYTYLRQNIQFTAYCYATTRPEFWTGWRGEDGFGPDEGTALYERFKTRGRRGTWINMRNPALKDAGWRGPDDYARFALAVNQIVASMKADIYPLSLSGDTCQYCDFRDICAGTGVPASDHGRP